MAEPRGTGAGTGAGTRAGTRAAAPDDAHAPPLPPPDLADRPLPLATLPADDRLVRVHRRDLGALHFGPGAGRAPAGRFDDPACPACAYGVCYLGRTREAAFAESFLRRPPVRLVSRAFLDERLLTTFALARPLRVVPLAGAALAALGATAAVASGPHGAARRWARALWAHPDAPDALTWRCRHDDDQWAVALFDRAADALAEVERIGVRTDRGWFGRTLDRYGVALDD